MNQARWRAQVSPVQLMKAGLAASPPSSPGAEAVGLGRVAALSPHRSSNSYQIREANRCLFF